MVVLQGKLFQNALLALTSTILTLFAFEIAFRIHAHLENRGILDRGVDLGIEPPADGPAELGHLIRRSPNRRIIYDLQPGLDLVYAGARVRTDSHGLRSPSTPEELAAAGFRIVGLGDSFMFGQGVAEDETYLAVLESRLRERCPDLGARIVNLAVPGYNTVMEVETLKEKALGWRPDLVIIDFVANDLRLPNFIRTKNDVFALDRSFLTDFVDHRFYREDEATLAQRLLARGLEPGLHRNRSQVPEEYRDMVGMAAYVGALRELRDLSRKHGFEVLSITLTQPKPLHLKAMKKSEQLGFHVLNVGREFRRYMEERGIDKYLDSPLARSPTDGHPSPLGHRLAAEVIYRFLRDEVLPMSVSG